MLLHPLQELQPVYAAARAQLRTSSPAQFQGEAVVWSSRDVPLLVTYNEVGAVEVELLLYLLISTIRVWGARVCVCLGCCEDGKGSWLRC